MKVIMLQDVNKVGSAGDVVKVSNGFARNYLLPRKFAIVATANALSKIDSIKKKIEIEKLEAENQLKALALKIQEVELSFIRKADENGHLYGSVSEIDIVNSLKDKEIDIHKNNVELEKHLKELGDFEISIVLSSEIKTSVKLKILPE